MQLILSRLITNSELSIEYSMPELGESKNIEQILLSIIKENRDDGYIDDFILAEDGSFLNYMFEIPSQNHMDGCELLMLTAILDEHENSKVFEDKFKITIEKLSNYVDIYLAFDTSKINEKNALLAQTHIQNTMYYLYNSLEKMLKGKIGLAQLILLGIQAVGKTTIIKTLVSGEFQPTKPTLAPQMLKLYFEQIDFRVYDVGGQKGLRFRWKNTLNNPNAIIYVIDLAGDKAKNEESLKEFDDIMDFFFHHNTMKNLPEDTPLLILANKMDLNESITVESLEKEYTPEKFTSNFMIEEISAKTGEGLIPAFKWFASQIKLMKNW